MKFTMAGRLSDCLLLAYRTPATSVRRLIPSGLELVTHGDWAFWNIVACRIESMRPAGFPRWFGVRYDHVAYRLYVRARVEVARQEDPAHLEGLYFVRSDADRQVLAWLGNIVSDFRFHPAKIAWSVQPGAVGLDVTQTPGRSGDACLRVEETFAPSLAPDSCFHTPQEAARFLKYRPLGLSCDRAGRRVKLAEVLREEANWKEQPVKVTEARWAFLESLGQEGVALERATRVDPIEYRWRLGATMNMAVDGHALNVAS